jgi:hypothetical protein
MFLFLIQIAGFAAIGDANNDGSITIVDALVVAQYYVGLAPAGFTLSNADVDSSGSVDVVDALLIAQYYVGLITQFPGQAATPAPTAIASNVAQGKTASADSQESGNEAAKGNDGSTTTRWCANDGSPNHFWAVDLGGFYNLSNTEIMWEYGDRAYQYKIEVSEDSSSWNLALDRTTNTTITQVSSDSFNVVARYMRITVTGLAAGTWASFFEFRAFGVTAPNPTPGPTAGSVTPEPTIPPGYTLVWSEEFNYSGTPDPANWGYESGYVRNNEAQYYEQANASCDGSELVIEARKNDGGYAYTSSSLITQGKHQWTYGRFEMRGKIPCVTGSWPAWWAVGIGANGSWPQCGEIDMMEYYKSTLLANVCYQNAGGSQVWDSATKSLSTFASDWPNNFHTWVMEWDTNTISLYCDDALLNSFNVNDATVGSYNPFRTSIWMFANLAIGGNNGGDPSGTTFPLRYYIDYIRVYQKQ